MPILKQVSRGADLYFTFRFLRLLTMKWTKTDAYKYKIIDSKGKVLRKSSELESVDEKAAYTMFHRLVYKMRRLLEKIPIIGKTILTNYAAALLLLKEQNNTRIWTDENYLKQRLMEFLETDWEEDAKLLKEEMDNMDKKGFQEFLTEGESRKDALRMALAKHKFKKAGGKVEKQPPSPAVGSTKYRGIMMAVPKTKEDEKMAQDIKDYRKKMGKKQRYYPQGYTRVKKEGIDIKKADMKDVIKDFQSSDAPQFKGKSDKKKKEMAIAAKLSSESVETNMGAKVLKFKDFTIDEKWEAGEVYHQDFGGGEISYFRADSLLKNKRWKGMAVDEYGGKQKRPRNITADEKTQGWKLTPKNEIPKGLKEKVELDEGKFKKGDIVIPNIGPHKGEKHTIIHDFKNGSYNISLNKKHSRYDQGAAKAKENQLKLVKEETEIEEGVTGPTRMQVQDYFQKQKGLLRVRINATEKAFKIRNLKIEKGMVQSFDEEVELDEAKVKPAKDVGLECQECLHKFRSKNPRYGITKCPKCKSTDLDLQYGEEVEDEAYGGTEKWKKGQKKMKKAGVALHKKDRYSGYVEEVELDEKLVSKLKIKPKKVKKLKDLRLYKGKPAKTPAKGHGSYSKYSDTSGPMSFMKSKSSSGYVGAYNSAELDGEDELDERSQWTIKNTKTGQRYSVSKYKDDKALDKIRKAGGDHKHAAHYKDGKLLDEAKMGSSDTQDMYALMVKGMKAVPGSPKQKEIIKQINVIRKRMGMPLMKEEFLNEVKSDYEKEIAAFKKGGGKVKKLKPDKPFKSKFKKTGEKVKRPPRQEEVEVDEARKKEVVKLPPHLAKFFDKDGNLKDKKMAAKITKDRAMRGVKITDVTPDWMFGEETEMDESLSLQATMALSDAGIKSKWKKGKLYVAKKDIKKAEKALSKSFKKGGEPDLYHENLNFSSWSDYGGEDIEEEVPTNSAGGGAIAGLDIGLTNKKKKADEKKARAALTKLMVGESVKMSTFAGKDVFIVDNDMFHDCRMGKRKYHRYEKYVGTRKVGQAIREYGLKYPKRPIILQNGENGPMLYLRYGGS